MSCYCLGVVREVGGGSGDNRIGEREILLVKVIGFVGRLIVWVRERVGVMFY